MTAFALTVVFKTGTFVPKFRFAAVASGLLLALSESFCFLFFAKRLSLLCTEVGAHLSKKAGCQDFAPTKNTWTLPRKIKKLQQKIQTEKLHFTKGYCLIKCQWKSEGVEGPVSQLHLKSFEINAERLYQLERYFEARCDTCRLHYLLQSFR